MYIGRLVPCLFNCLVDLAPYPDISSARNFLLNFFLSCDNRKICKERKKCYLWPTFSRVTVVHFWRKENYTKKNTRNKICQGKLKHFDMRLFLIRNMLNDFYGMSSLGISKGNLISGNTSSCTSQRQ